MTPYRPRPETTPMVARNLVAGALGIRSNVPKSVRDAEKRKLKCAKGLLLIQQTHSRKYYMAV